LLTSGGGNINRTQNQTEQGYETEHKDGTRDAKLFINGVEAKSGVGKFKGGDNGA
jgi:hypothetical protein